MLLLSTSGKTFLFSSKFMMEIPSVASLILGSLAGNEKNGPRCLMTCETTMNSVVVVLWFYIFLSSYYL